MKHIARNLAIVFVALAMLGAVFFRTSLRNRLQKDKYTEEPLTPLTLIAPDVGKGDAFIFICEGQTLVIDTGYEKTFSAVQKALDEAGITVIDKLVLSHYDKDHVGGADLLLQNYEVKDVYGPNYASDSKQYNQFIQELAQQDLSLICPEQIETFSLGSAKISLCPALQSSYEDENDYSMVVAVEHGNDRMLFAGDAEALRIQELMSQITLDFNFLKVPHHGRTEEFSSAFFNSISPVYALITCSAEEEPDREVLDTLAELQTQVYLTKDGSITAVGTGTGILEITQ